MSGGLRRGVLGMWATQTERRIFALGEEGDVRVRRSEGSVRVAYLLNRLKTSQVFPG